MAEKITTEYDREILVYSINNLKPKTLKQEDCIQDSLEGLRKQNRLNFLVEAEAYKDLSKKQYVLILGFMFNKPDFSGGPLQAEIRRSIFCEFE